MTTIPKHSFARMAVLVLAAVFAAACGGDDAPAKPKKAAKDPAAAKDAAAGKPAAGTAAAPRSKRKGKKVALEVYPRIDEKYRRELKEQDFLPDPSGDERRDPFQSFVVRQGNATQLSMNQVPIQPTKVCTALNTRAAGFLLRDLRLIGIILRGTRGMAHFRDKAGKGWLVRRGECLGKEQAVVQAIGVGSVTLEVIPETPPNAPPPQPQRQDIALYPEELEIGLTGDGQAPSEQPQ